MFGRSLEVVQPEQVKIKNPEEEIKITQQEINKSEEKIKKPEEVTNKSEFEEIELIEKPEIKEVVD